MESFQEKYTQVSWCIGHKGILIHCYWVQYAVTRILMNGIYHVISAARRLLNNIAPSVMQLLILKNYRGIKWIENDIRCWSLGRRREMKETYGTNGMSCKEIKMLRITTSKLREWEF